MPSVNRFRCPGLSTRLTGLLRTQAPAHQPRRCHLRCLLSPNQRAFSVQNTSSFELRKVPSGPQSFDEPFKPKTEEWYNYYLRRQLSYKPFDQETTLQLDLDTCPPRQVLGDPELQMQPLSLFEKNEAASVELACTCLRTFMWRVRESRVSKSERRQAYVDAQPGKKALRWVLQTGAYDRLDYVYHSTFTGALTRCLIADGNAEALWQWIIVDEDPTFIALVENGLRRRWRANLLNDMLKAQTYWADEDNSLSAPLTTLYRAINYSENLLPAQKVPVRTALLWMVRVAFYLHPGAPLPGVDFCESMQHHLRTLLGGSQMAEHWSALLALLHSQNGDPDPILRFFRNPSGDKDRAAYIQYLFDKRVHIITPSVDKEFARIAQIFVRLERPQDAKWILDFAYDHFPEQFAAGCYKSYDISDRRQEDYRRKATAAEKRQGVPVDKDGMIQRRSKENLHLYSWRNTKVR